MFFRKRRKKKKKMTEEQLEKVQKRSEQSQVSQMMAMSADFEKSKVEAALASAKTFKRFGMAGLALAGLAVGAVMGLTPLKEVDPFTIKVDSNTGAAEVITSIKNKDMTYDEVTNKYWLAEYVRYRESYDWNTIQATYDATNLMSAHDVQTEFKALYNSPMAPHKVLKQNAKVIAKVNSIAFVGNMAQVRFEKRVMPTSGQSANPMPPEKMIATIAFEFKATPMKEADRLINPLGFQVISYRVDPESAP